PARVDAHVAREPPVAFLSPGDVREGIENAPDAEPEVRGHTEDEVLELPAIAADELACGRQPRWAGVRSAPSVAMHDLDLRHVPDREGGAAHPLAPLDVFAVHEEAAVEEAGPADRRSARDHARAAHPVDRHRLRAADE